MTYGLGDQLLFREAKRSEAHTVPDLRLSPLAVVVSPSKTRIIHDSTFSSSQYARTVNADTDFAQPPP